MKNANRAIGLKKVSDGAAGTGVVKEIRMGSEYGHADPSSAHVVIQHGADPKPSKPGKPSEYREPRRSRFDIPASVARTLKIGQRVRIDITPC
jgi:hypothetical protein